MVIEDQALAEPTSKDAAIRENFMVDG